MSELKSAENLYLIVEFVVPGVIALYFRSQILTGRPINQKDQFITLITITLLWNFLWKNFESTEIGNLYFYNSKINAIFSLFFGPAIFGILLGLNDRRGWMRAILANFGIHTVDPFPAAWDRRFNKYDPCWVLLTLKDGTKVAGFLGTDSIVSSDLAERDIFISEKYDLADDGTWTPAGGGGILVAHGEIRLIEFWPDNENGMEH